MPKTKTHSGSKKRFKRTANGKVRRWHAFKSHNLNKQKKSTKQKRNLTHSTLVSKGDLGRVRKLMHYKNK